MKNLAKSLYRLLVCFVAAFVVSVVIAKIFGVEFNRTEPEIIYAKDVPVITSPINPTTSTAYEYNEYEDEDEEPDESAYKRMIYVTEHVIVIEFTETEEELLAPPIKADDFEPFDTYVYAGERKPIPISDNTQRIIYRISTEYGLPYRMVLAIFGAETTWNEDPDHTEVHDGVKYIGMGCINEKYHADNLAKKGIDIYTLSGNIEGVCYLLKAQHERFDDITYAIMAYNGGAGYVIAQIEKGVTENSYTRAVKRYAESFE